MSDTTRKIFLFLPLALASLALSSCQSPTPPEPSLFGVRGIGEVIYRDGEMGFVLFKVWSGLPLEVGQELEVRRGEETIGRLRVSPEKKRSLWAADILEGAPVEGDLVILPPPDMPAAAGTGEKKQPES